MDGEAGLSWFQRHDAFTKDVKDASNLHHPFSCFRPPVAGQVDFGPNYVDWPRLKQEAWTFASMPYDPDKSLDFICPAWWNATACECGCGDCSQLFEQCPAGFMLFRAMALLCDARQEGGYRVRIHELMNKKWGCGLLNLASLRLKFVDILHSGWPYFGVLARLSDQLRLDGLAESEAARQLRMQQDELRTAAGDEPELSTLCSATGWPENLYYLRQLGVSLATGEPVPLESSMQAAREPACPLQRASAYAAVLDWLLQPPPGKAAGGQWLSFKALKEVERVVQKVEENVRTWAAVGSGDSCQGRSYFWEMLVTAWPVWQFLQRAGVRLIAALSVDCQGQEKIPHEAMAQLLVVEPSRSLSSPEDLRFCPACDCPTQGEWAVEARWITEYAEQLGKTLFRRAACSLAGPAAWRAARIAEDPFRSWHERWEALRTPAWASSAARHKASRFPSLGKALPSPTVREPFAWPVRREAFVTVLFTQGAVLEQVLLHTEAIRTLAFSVRQHSVYVRPFLVITDGPLPDIVETSLLADGISVEMVRSQDWAFTGGAYGADSSSSAELTKWWLERGIAPTAVKLAIWNFTAYDCLVFLDADTLLLDSVDELFQISTFASGMHPYSSHGVQAHQQGYQSFVGINTGVMVVQPNAAVAAEMARQMASGQYGNSPIAEHLGQSDQPWLDAFWLHRNPRLGIARFREDQPGSHTSARTKFLSCDARFGINWGSLPLEKGPACSPEHAGRPKHHRPQPGRRRARPQQVGPPHLNHAHCILPLDYDFFVDYKALRMHVWYEARLRKAHAEEDPLQQIPMQNASDIEYSVAQYIHTYEALGKRGPKILHWPGEMRKPWHRWRPAVRSPWDKAWWRTHRAMCKASSAECHMHCSR